MFYYEYGYYINHRNGTKGEHLSWIAQLGATVHKEVRLLLNKIDKSKYESSNETKGHLTHEIIDLSMKEPNEIGGLSDMISGTMNMDYCGVRTQPPRYPKTPGMIERCI